MILFSEPDRILISPNPTNGQFTVSNIPFGIKGIELLSISGAKIYQDEVAGDIYKSRLSGSNLAPGVYILLLKGKGKRIVKELIIN